MLPMTRSYTFILFVMQLLCFLYSLVFLCLLRFYLYCSIISIVLDLLPLQSSGAPYHICFLLLWTSDNTTSLQLKILSPFFSRNSLPPAVFLLPSCVTSSTSVVSSPLFSPQLLSPHIFILFRLRIHSLSLFILYHYLFFILIYSLSLFPYHDLVFSNLRERT